MQTANAKNQISERTSLRQARAAFFALRSFARDEHMPAMRMRMHAQQAKAAAAALFEG
jgi:hypothetical protein